MRWQLCASMVAVLFVAARADAQRTSLRGMVIDSVSREPIAAVEVRLQPLGQILDMRAVSASDGAFVISSIPPGRYVLTAERLGYHEYRDSITIERGVTSPTHLALRPSPVRVTEVAAEAEAQPRLNIMSGFWERRKQPNGYFLTREDIDQLRPHHARDLFRRIPGARIDVIGYGYVVTFNRNRRPNLPPCVPATFVDGVPYVMTERGLDDFNPATIEGIEVYTSAATIPAQFNVTGRDRRPERSDQIMGSPQCGAIVIWTRIGGS